MTIQMSLDVLSFNPFTQGMIGSLVPELSRVEEDWAKRLVGLAEQYPPERPGQHYVRTFTFQQEWHISPARLEAGDLVCDVENPTSYAEFVVGDDEGLMQNQQFHAGRWYLFRTLVQQSELQFRQDVQDVINRVLQPARITP